MLARYAHLANERLREAEAKLTALVAGKEPDRVSRIITVPTKKAAPPKKRRQQAPHSVLVNGGADGARTRDLRSDSPVC